MSQSDRLGSIWLHLEHSEVPIPQTSTWSGTFFDTQYKNPALVYSYSGSESEMEILP